MHMKLVLLLVLFALSSAAPPRCGDNSASGPLEQCDGTDLGGNSCGSFCYTGSLGCTSDCHFNFAGCVENTCGDGVALRSEQCDSSDLRGQTCASMGFDAGTLTCTSGCHYNTSACVHWFCGDGLVTGTEQCDGSNLNGKGCTDAGFDAGTLACRSDCTFDTSSCTRYYCGDGLVTAGETCDGSNLNGGTCANKGFNYGIISCASDCHSYVTTGCHSYYCGDGMVTAGEQCDGTNFGGYNCASIPWAHFANGSLSCTSGCMFNTTLCTTCGDGVIVAPYENCEPSLMQINQTCSAYGYASGTLTCGSSCRFNTTQCVVPDKDCVTNQPNITTLVQCYEAAIIPASGMSTLVLVNATYQAAYASVVSSMLLNDGNCTQLVMPSILSGAFQIRLFTDSATKVEYCVLMDCKDSDHNNIWDNGWGLFVVPNRRYDIQRHIHLALAHPSSDANVSPQAARLFSSAGLHSLQMWGINRNAYIGAPSTCHTTQTATDPNEDNRTVFHTTFQTVMNTSTAQGWPNNYFIQMHGGITPAGCGSDVLVSYGITAAGNTYYTTPGNMALAIANYFKSVATLSFNTSTPFNDTTCAMTGVTSVQGRIANGVPIGSECGTAATTASLKYIHIEQKANPRTALQANAWADTFRTLFPTDCAPGRAYNMSTKMCSP